MTTIRERYHTAHNYLVRNKYLDNWTFWHTIIPAIAARVGLMWLEPQQVVGWVLLSSVMWEVVELNWAPQESYGGFRPWLNNSVSDIFVATLAAVLVVF